MGSEVEKAYAYAEERLDLPYVRQCAGAVAAALHAGQPIEVCFQPGDGTRYDLLFVPVQPGALEQAPERVAAQMSAPERGPIGWGAATALGVSREPGKALVAWYDHNALGLDLSCGGFVPAYLAERFHCTLGSGVALFMLFESIAEAFNG